MRHAGGAGAEGSSAAGILSLNRWIKAISTLIGADAGCIILTDTAAARVIARHNIPHAFLASAAKVDKAPWSRDETLLLPNALARHDVHAMLGDIALESTGFFYRRPLLLDDARTFALVIYGLSPRAAPGRREMQIIDELVKAMVEELERHYPAEDALASRSMRLTTSELDSWLAATPTPTAIFDDQLCLTMLNSPMVGLFPAITAELIGKPLNYIHIPAREGLDFLFRHALSSGLSTPKFELAIEETGLRLHAMASPLTMLDGKTVLVVTVEPLGSAIAVQPVGRALKATRAKGAEQATVSFLSETLVRKRSLRSRNGISYITLRAWRQSIRQHQIRALRALKTSAAADLAEEMADDVAADVAALVGAGIFRSVVPMPCGHSAPESCLSRMLAVALGKRLDLPVLHVLGMQRLEGSSHPRGNARRPPITLLHPAQGPLLLVDDVATSGSHIEEATGLLRQCAGSVLALAWIGGDAVADVHREE